MKLIVRRLQYSALKLILLINLVQRPSAVGHLLWERGPDLQRRVHKAARVSLHDSQGKKYENCLALDKSLGKTFKLWGSWIADQLLELIHPGWSDQKCFSNEIRTKQSKYQRSE